MKKDIKILAIETSCDETAAAVISGVLVDPKKQCHSREDGNLLSVDPRVKPEDDRGYPVILSNIVSSQVDLHALTGGVVPEVASRAHLDSILPVITEALTQAKLSESPNVKCQMSNQCQNPKSKYREILRTAQDDNKNNRTIQQFNNVELSSITHLAVTAGPGLIGSLLVGFNTAKSLAYGLDIPIIPINHIEGHIYSALGGVNPNVKFLISNQIQNPKSKKNNSTMEQPVTASVSAGPSPDREARAEAGFNNETIDFPILALTVSGGHTSLTLIKDHGVYQNIGSTLDDAAGEAFDKVAKLLNLGYPGGPIVSQYAENYRRKNPNIKLQMSNKNLPMLRSGSRQVIFVGTNTKNIVFPRPLLRENNFNFSFSGLKTAVLQETKNNELRIKNKEYKEEICWAFEEAVIDVLVTKTMRAANKYRPNAIILAGGVAANSRLRQELEANLQAKKLGPKKLTFLPAPRELCGDNAAMIGLAAYYHIAKGDVSTWSDIKIDANLKL